MKTYLQLLFLLASGLTVFSQPWSEPVILTDTVSYNSNPEMFVFDNGYGTAYLLFEKKWDENSKTEIWIKNITESLIEQPVLADENIEFRNPCIVVENGVYLLYESNSKGNFDIYGGQFFADGTFGEPFVLTNTLEDEKDMSVSNVYYTDRPVCWIKGGDVMFSYLSPVADTLVFDNIVTIDTGNCYEPVFNSTVVYRKINGSNSSVYYSQFYGGEWLTPDTVMLEGNNHDLSVQMFSGPDYNLDPYNIFWENNGQIYYGYYNSVTPIPLSGFEHMHHPSSFLVLVGDNVLSAGRIVFSAGEGDEEDIYVGYPEITSYENLTNDNRRDYNPDFFIGERYGQDAEHTIIWQSEINGKSALCMIHKMDYFVGIDEQVKRRSLFTAYPNPFSEQLTIRYNLEREESGTLEIFDLKGVKVFAKNLIKQGNDEQTTIWVPESNPEGEYLIKIMQGKYEETRKVIYTK